MHWWPTPAASPWLAAAVLNGGAEVVFLFCATSTYTPAPSKDAIDSTATSSGVDLAVWLYV